MTALYFDTGSFQHSNTTSTVMDVSANLMLHEVQHNEIAYQLFQKKLLPMLKLWGIALNKLNVDEANGISWVFISQDDFKQSGAEAKDIEGLINLMHGIPKIKMTVILSERENGMVKGSIRTQEGVDASYYAAVFGGGGHNKAAGFNANLLNFIV